MDKAVSVISSLFSGFVVKDRSGSVVCTTTYYVRFCGEKGKGGEGGKGLV